jgi:hypothetical protein
VEQGAPAVTVRQASELTGAAGGTIRAAVRRGAIAKVGTLAGGPYARDRWLLDYSSVMGWHQRSGLPAPVPADPLRLALSGDLKVALDRALAMAALRRLEAERGRLVAERRRVAAARTQLLNRR